MLSWSHSICNSLCRMPDKKHSPFIVREAWLCVLVIESCRGSNGKCYDHWRKGMETNTVPCLPQQTTSQRNLSAGYKNGIPAMSYCRGCTTWLYCMWLCAGSEWSRMWTRSWHSHPHESRWTGCFCKCVCVCTSVVNSRGRTFLFLYNLNYL